MLTSRQQRRDFGKRSCLSGTGHVDLASSTLLAKLVHIFWTPESSDACSNIGTFIIQSLQGICRLVLFRRSCCAGLTHRGAFSKECYQWPGCAGLIAQMSPGPFLACQAHTGNRGDTDMYCDAFPTCALVCLSCLFRLSGLTHDCRSRF